MVPLSNMQSATETPEQQVIHVPTEWLSEEASEAF